MSSERANLLRRCAIDRQLSKRPGNGHYRRYLKQVQVTLLEIRRNRGIDHSYPGPTPLCECPTIHFNWAAVFTMPGDFIGLERYLYCPVHHIGNWESNIKRGAN